MNKKIVNSKKIKITQIKSTIGRDKKQKTNLLSLGLKKIGNSGLNCEINTNFFLFSFLFLIFIKLFLIEPIL